MNHGLITLKLGVFIRVYKWTTMFVQAFCRNAMPCDVMRYDHIMLITVTALEKQ